MGERVPNNESNLAKSSHLRRLMGGAALASSLSLLPACSYFEEPKSDAAVIIQMSCEDAKTGSPTPIFLDAVHDLQTANSDSGMYQPDITQISCQPGSVLSGTPHYSTISLDKYKRSDLGSNKIAILLEDVLGRDEYVATFDTRKNDAGRADGVTIGTNATANIAGIESADILYHAEGK